MGSRTYRKRHSIGIKMQRVGQRWNTARCWWSSVNRRARLFLPLHRRRIFTRLAKVRSLDCDWCRSALQGPWTFHAPKILRCVERSVGVTRGWKGKAGAPCTPTNETLSPVHLCNLRRKNKHMTKHVRSVPLSKRRQGYV